MAIFTAVSMWATAALGAGSLSVFGLSPALTSALFAAGRSVGWSLASQALARQNVPRQQVQANINQLTAWVYCCGRLKDLFEDPKARIIVC